MLASMALLFTINSNGMRAVQRVAQTMHTHRHRQRQKHKMSNRPKVRHTQQ